jgi:UDP-glucose 4-epimerase
VNVLVTGGAGYIGSVVAHELVKSGHKVVVCDNLSHGYRAAVPKEAEFMQAEVGEARVVTDVLRKHKIEAVMHFAALIEVGESMRMPERYFQNNTGATLTLLEAMVANGVNRFVFSSTAALYGEPEHTPIQESDALKPANAYGESKLLVERILDWLNRIHGFRYASLRYFNAAGAAGELGEAHEPESHLIPLVLQVPLGKRQSVSIFGTDYPTPDGSCVRDYVHVLDLAQAHRLALDALGEKTRLIYNLGNGRGFSVRQVIETARKITGHAIPVIEAPRRPGDPAVLVASSEKIRSELNWKPQHASLEDIIGSAWEWHRKHPNGYRS